ncbi:hypothetical protein V6N12_064216 [Hibiscus sabdariffa]|uniref:Leucine-rich repeat-containing N-terminal plant-type domain-containing protein n=1 Tax=Hibiscus sabdariffa TaxID=183260 RepID=A0ABR2G561_9ROSI
MHRVDTMKIKRFWMLVIVLSVGVLSETDQGCLEQERVALLQLKSFFNSPFFLRDWVGSDCCQWGGVTCSNTSRRLIQLYLDNTRQLQGHGYLNASLFLPFKELKSLSLVGNGIAGFVHTRGALKKLEILDLTDNQLNDSILPWLSELSSLKSLDLTGNGFTGSNHRDELSRLRKLRSLDLSWNSIERFQGKNVKNLEELDLSGNHLQNSSFAFISGLSNLKSLTIQHNNMQGSIDIKELNKLAKLEEMDLSYNPIKSLGSIYGTY